MGKHISWALTVLLIISTLLGSLPQSAAAQDTPTVEAQAEASPTVPGEPLATVEPATPSPTATETEAAPAPTETATPTLTDEPTATTEAERTATASATAAVTPPTATSTATPELQAAETATLQVRTVDQDGALILNRTYRAFQKTDEGSYLWPPFESWDFENPDGISLFPPMPTGVPIAIISDTTPRGHLGPTGEFAVVTLTPGETRTIEIVFTLGGTVTVHGVDQNDDPRPDGCYTAYEDLDGLRGEVVSGACDSGGFGGDPNDGLAVLESLPGGSFLLGAWSQSPNWVPGPDVPFSVALGGTAEVTFTFVPAGTIVIHKRKADGAPLPGSCFIIFRDEGGGANNGSGIGGGCDHQDGADDGEITFPAPLGDIVIHEDLVPHGYIAAEDLLVHVESGQTQTFTVVDPLASTLQVQITDLWGHPVYDQTCLFLSIDAGDGTPSPGAWSACSKVIADKSVVTFDLLRPGDYVLTLEGVNAPGYYRNDPMPVTVGLSTTKTVKFRLNGPSPKLLTGPFLGTLTQTEALIHWETDQPTIGSIRYGLSESFGSNVGPSATEERIHRLKLTGLSAGRTYYLEIKSTNGNGTVVSETYFFRTPSATSTARLLIIKTNGDGSVRLGGSCFVVHKDLGDGRLGTAVGGGCDKFDAAPNDGVIGVNGLAAGAYVLVETLSPSGYSLARNTRFSISDGQTKRITVKDTRGGAVLTVSTESDSGLVPGACYAIYANVDGRVGPRVSANCDRYDGLDGKTRLGALRAGRYFLEITEVPFGYLPAGLDQYWQVDITSGQRSAEHRFALLSESAPDNIIIRTVDGSGNLLPGACFALYEAISGPDPLNADACDADDGHYDGRTIFKHMPGIRYAAAEFIAPPGYQVGARVSFTKTDGVLRTLTVVQTPGNLKVTVTTLKGGTTAKLGGACYGLYRAGGYHDFVTGACDTNLDGVVVMAGVPSGTYLLAQTATPPGYKTPSYRTITVGTRSTSQTVRTYPQ